MLLLGGGRVASFLLLVLLATTAQAQQFERRLLPVTVERLPGARGSLWTTEVVSLHERSGIFVAGFVPECPGCGPSPAVAPRTPFASRIYSSGAGEPPGSIVYVAAADAELVHLSTRVRDLTSAITLPVSVPVVRERDFGKAIFLPVVSVSPSSRVTLRIYSLDLQVEEPVVRVEVMSNEPFSRVLFSGDVRLSARQRRVEHSRQFFDIRPLAAELALESFIPSLSIDGSVAIFVTPRAEAFRIWAFASTTQGDSAQISLALPD